MHAIKAIWTNGRILPSEPVDWPEGSRLLVEPEVNSQKVGLDESEWRDDPGSIAAWMAWVDTVEPPVYTDEERADMERFRAEHRRYNIDAVRRQMGLEEPA